MAALASFVRRNCVCLVSRKSSIPASFCPKQVKGTLGLETPCRRSRYRRIEGGLGGTKTAPRSQKRLSHQTSSHPKLHAPA